MTTIEGTLRPVLTEFDAARHLRLAREHLAPGIALAQKLNGQGAVEWAAQGAEVQLSDGRTVLDFGSYAVTLLGHRHPRILAAVRDQLDAVPVSTRVLCNPVTARLAERLVATVDPGRLRHVWFGLNGSDVVDASLKLARLATGRDRLLAARGAFHGKTFGTLAATWGERYRAGLEHLLPPVTHLDPDDPSAVGREVTAGDVAALIVEPVQGEGGVRPLRPDVLRQWARDAHAAGCFLVSDEIQAGLRRCGPLSLAVTLGLEPDAVLFAKPLGGGVVPLSAMVATAPLYAPITADPFVHTSTFSGHPLGCAAALAALDVIEDLSEYAEGVSRNVAAMLRQLRERHPDALLAVRGQGLMWGLELAPQVLARAVLEISRRGLLLAPCLIESRVVRLLPPMVTTEAQVDRAATTLDEALRVATEAA